MPEFDKNRKRVECCPCGKSNSDGKFIPYIGYEDKGYCHSCGECYFPDGKMDKRSWDTIQDSKKSFSVLNCSFLKNSLKDFDENNFVKGLRLFFGEEIFERLVADFYIGTSNKFPGATIFWYIDKHFNIRSGKIMLYDAYTLKRIKEFTKDFKSQTPFGWIHYEILGKKAKEIYQLNLCFFGEHQLHEKPEYYPVAIVESEKTAIISSIYLPQYIWLATGSKTGLTKSKMKSIKGRKVTLFPDIDGYEKWEQYANRYSTIADMNIDYRLLEMAPQYQLNEKADLADLLLLLPVGWFSNIEVIPQHTLPVPEILNKKQASLSHEVEHTVFSNATYDIEVQNEPRRSDVNHSSVDIPTNIQNWYNQIVITIKETEVKLFDNMCSLWKFFPNKLKHDLHNYSAFDLYELFLFCQTWDIVWMEDPVSDYLKMMGQKFENRYRQLRRFKGFCQTKL